MNCEGSKLAILDSIALSEKNRIVNALIDFDALKITSLRTRVDLVMNTVQRSAPPYSVLAQVQHGLVTNYGGIHNCLLQTCELSKFSDCQVKKHDLQSAYTSNSAGMLRLSEDAAPRLSSITDNICP